MKKRLLGVTILAVLVMSIFTACGKKDAETEINTQVQEEVDVTTESTEGLLVESTEVLSEETTETETEVTEVVSTEVESTEATDKKDVVEEITQEIAQEIQQEDAKNTIPQESVNNSEWIAPPSSVSDAELPIVKDTVNRIITAGMSELEKAKAIHDWMLMNIDYDYNNYLNDTIPGSSRTVDGVLSTRYAVCEGYANTFRALCKAAGLECECVVGDTPQGYHGWNQVRIDGQWYNIDVTWDDPVGKDSFDDHSHNRYDYFLLSDAEMYADHIAHNANHTCSNSLRSQAMQMHCPWRNYDYIASYDALSAAVASQVANNSSVMTLAIDPNCIDVSNIYGIIRNEISKCNVVDDYEIVGITYTNDPWGITTYTCNLLLNNGVFTQFTLISSEEMLKQEILKLSTSTTETQYLYVTEEFLGEDNSVVSDAIGKWLYFDVGLVMYSGTTSPLCDGVRKVHVSEVRPVTAEDSFIENAYSFADVEAIIQDRLARGLTNFTVRYCTNTREEEEAAYSQVVSEMKYQWEETYNLFVTYSAQSTTTFFIIFGPAEPM